MPRRRSVKPTSMHPELHDQVSDRLLEDDLDLDFYDVDSPRNCIKEYDTNIMGRFDCRNRACDSSGWGSKKIAITIRLYDQDRYNAKVYHQRCRSCNTLGHPRLDEEAYVDRVTYRLKKWSGVDQDVQRFTRGESKGPHQSELCEGCKAGHCREGLQ